MVERRTCNADVIGSSPVQGSRRKQISCGMSGPGGVVRDTLREKLINTNEGQYGSQALNYTGGAVFEEFTCGGSIPHCVSIPSQFLCKLSILRLSKLKLKVKVSCVSFKMTGVQRNGNSPIVYLTL